MPLPGSWLRLCSHRRFPSCSARRRRIYGSFGRLDFFFFPHFQSSPSALSLPRAPDTAERREATSGRAVPGPVPCPRCPGCPQSCPRAAAAGAEPPAGAGPQPPGPRRAWVPSVLPRIYSIRQLGMLGREEGGLIR